MVTGLPGLPILAGKGRCAAAQLYETNGATVTPYPTCWEYDTENKKYIVAKAHCQGHNFKYGPPVLRVPYFDFPVQGGRANFKVVFDDESHCSFYKPKWTPDQAAFNPTPGETYAQEMYKLFPAIPQPTDRRSHPLPFFLPVLLPNEWEQPVQTTYTIEKGSLPNSRWLSIPATPPFLATDCTFLCCGLILLEEPQEQEAAKHHRLVAEPLSEVISPFPWSEPPAAAAISS